MGPHTLQNPIPEATVSQFLANGNFFIRRAGTNAALVILWTADPKTTLCLDPATYMENLSFPKGPVSSRRHVGKRQTFLSIQ